MLLAWNVFLQSNKTATTTAAASSSSTDSSKSKRKFSSFFKSLVIELDKDLYGPDNHLVEVRVASCYSTEISCKMLIFSVVAPHDDHSRNRRFPSEASGRPERQVHCAAHAWLPTSTVQARPSPRQTSWCSHSDETSHHQQSVAVHQNTQAARQPRTRVHQQRQVLATGACCHVYVTRSIVRVSYATNLSLCFLL